jgi:hypothetical protein
MGAISRRWKMGVSKTSDARKMTAMPMSFITKPALMRSLVFILPLTKIIALGGVAMQENAPINDVRFKSHSPMGNMKDNETAMHEGKIRRAGCMLAVFACSKYQRKLFL